MSILININTLHPQYLISHNIFDMMFYLFNKTAELYFQTIKFEYKIENNMISKYTISINII